MPGSALLRAIFPVLICLAAMLWLIYGFLNVSVWLKGGLTIATCIAALSMASRRYRHQHPVKAQEETEFTRQRGLPDRFCWFAAI
ncbi:Uncharacterised protein [Raoultella terrigena]|uniref:Uncharacterized protein n=1 Tax=Raoultella terrigena TaxID=577 RepID=A0A3P8IWS8_RAOTE|nr:Uncharacterised protein [Raoultella terrigena]